MREAVSDIPSPEHIRQRRAQGWKLVALEWERTDDGEETSEKPARHEIPFGLRVSGDCSHLEDDPLEMQTLVTMMELIVQDKSLSQVAHELNLRGFATRQGGKWRQVAVFEILPCLIDVGPEMFSNEEWARRRRLF